MGLHRLVPIQHDGGKPCATRRHASSGDYEMERVAQALSKAEAQLAALQAFAAGRTHRESKSTAAGQGGRTPDMGGVR